MPSRLTALILGDIVGHSGCRALYVSLADLKKKYRADIVVANAENAADGFGLTPDIASQLLSAGIDVLTTGNHVWQKREILPVLERGDDILRPHNYPRGAPGTGVAFREVRGTIIAVVNLQGRVGMYDVDSPFAASTAVLKEVSGRASVTIVDFHAESSAEKEALGLYLDGKVSVVVGTHTHVQTADNRILPKGTAFMTDLGMTGPYRSVIGGLPSEAIRRSLTQMPIRMTVSDSSSSIEGAVVEIDTTTGLAAAISRITESPIL